MNELTLANRALRLAKLDTIDSLDDTNNAVAAYCRENQQAFIDELLGEKDWVFAKVRKSLTRLDIEFSDWDYVFDLPDDLIRIIRIIQPENNHRELYEENNDYEMFNDDSLADGASMRLASNKSELELLYVKQITVVARLPDYFTNALSYLYAFYLATTFGGAERSGWAFQMYTVRTDWAITQDNQRRRGNVKGIPVLTGDPLVYDPWGYSK